MVSVTATALGIAELEVRTPDEEVFARCIVNVKPPSEPIIESIIVERYHGGCQGQTAPGLVMGLAILAPAVFLLKKKVQGHRPWIRLGHGENRRTCRPLGGDGGD